MYVCERKGEKTRGCCLSQIHGRSRPAGKRRQTSHPPSLTHSADASEDTHTPIHKRITHTHTRAYTHEHTHTHPHTHTHTHTHTHKHTHTRTHTHSHTYIPTPT